MKMRLLLTLAALAIGFAVSAFAVSGRLSGDLAGDVKALGEFSALSTKYDEAFNKTDAAALAALFTEDAVCVTPEGLLTGRQAIERWYADHLQRWHMTNHIYEANQLNAIGNEIWSVGQWWGTLQSQNGPVFVRGYWSTLFVREGDAWKIRMLTFNKTLPAAPPAETK